MVVYTVRHLLPVASPPVKDGAVAIDHGSIVAVGGREDILADLSDNDEVLDLGDAVLLPGLVNAHTHVELCWMESDPLPQGDYLAWVRAFLERRDREDEAVARAAAEEGVKKLVARGTVAVGDVANNPWTAGILARSSLWAVVFRELYGFRASDAEGILEEAAGQLDAMEAETAVSDGRVRVTLTPHAPHTTSAPLLKALAGRAAATGSPLTIHLAESDVEAAFLQEGSGAFRDFLAEREMWDDSWEAPGQSPVDYLDRLNVLAPNAMAVHCVHLDRGDHSRLQSRGVTVVACPRSNELMGVGTAQIRKLLGEGIPVALGTDSLASVPDLDLFAEMAALLRLNPGLPPAAALRMATLNGARALGLGDRLGSIEPGKAAALIALPLRAGDDPLEAVVSEPEEVYRLEAVPLEEQDE
jgi:cytosine/adenosine deaminase-related metal-dependent hydrolase